MAASLLIEHDHGTYSGPVRGKHQGYYAGDFRTPPTDAVPGPGWTSGRQEPLRPVPVQLVRRNVR